MKYLQKHLLEYKNIYSTLHLVIHTFGRVANYRELSHSRIFYIMLKHKIFLTAPYAISNHFIEETGCSFPWILQIRAFLSCTSVIGSATGAGKLRIYLAELFSFRTRQNAILFAAVTERGSRHREHSDRDIDVRVPITCVSLKRNVPTVQPHSFRFTFRIVKRHCVKSERVTIKHIIL